MVQIYYQNDFSKPEDVYRDIGRRPYPPHIWDKIQEDFHCEVRLVTYEFLSEPSCCLCKMNKGWLGNVGTWPETEHFRISGRLAHVQNLREFWASSWHLFPPEYTPYNCSLQKFSEHDDGDPMRAWRLHKAGNGEESPPNSLYIARQHFRGNPTDTHGGVANTWSRHETGIVIKPNEWFRTTFHVIQDHEHGLFEFYHNDKLMLRKLDVETLRNPDARHICALHQCYTRNVPEGVVLWNYTDDWILSDEFIPMYKPQPPQPDNRFLLLLGIFGFLGLLWIASSKS